jgi:POT family proton-dependent oligopeptide transporter
VEKGTGLFKSNISPLIAEQYRRTKSFVITTSSGERVIVDPALTVSRMYMVSQPILITSLRKFLTIFDSQYFYLFINIGAVIGQISMTYAEKVRPYSDIYPDL